MAQAVDFRDEPDALFPRRPGQSLRPGFRDIPRGPQLRVRLKIKIVIHFGDDHVHTVGGKLRQLLHERVRLFIAAYHQMQTAPRDCPRRRRSARPRFIAGAATAKDHQGQHQAQRGAAATKEDGGSRMEARDTNGVLRAHKKSCQNCAIPNRCVTEEGRFHVGKTINIFPPHPTTLCF